MPEIGARHERLSPCCGVGIKTTVRQLADTLSAYGNALDPPDLAFKLLKPRSGESFVLNTIKHTSIGLESRGDGRAHDLAHGMVDPSDRARFDA